MTETGIGRQAAFFRRGLWRVAALSAAIALAGCQVVPKGQRALPPPPTARTDVIAPLPVDKERHRVALLVPMTGANAGVGRSIANATTMALFDTRTEKVRITTYDTATGAAAAAKKAIAEGNRLILGPLTADEVRAVTPTARAASVPLISFSNDVSIAGNGIYLMGYIPAQSVDRVVRFAGGKGVTNFAALVPKGVYGERAGSAFLKAVKDQGGNVVAMESFDRSSGSVAAAVKRLASASSYDALLIADLGRIAVQAAPLVRANGGQKARLLGTELWNTDSAVANGGALRGAWFASVGDGLYRQFHTKYRARYGAAPYRLASLGYDAVLLTVRIAQDWRPGAPFPAGRLNDRDGFAGLDGAFRFNQDGIAERALEVQEVGAGGPVVVDPAPKGFGR
ncbi:MAG TPA: penicillin-binding protein activator [Sphingobium sp.]|nr:penicillin-binding protein activator [Sphingobium sp.]